jgi:hypothetical protein
MANHVTENSPLAQALQSVVQPKLVELGWSTGGLDDSALSEYVILMLINDKTQDQISSELSNDLLGLGPDDPGAAEFSKWLFEQLHSLNAQINGGQQNNSAAQGEVSSIPNNADNSQPTQTPAMSGQDADMADGNDTPQATIPTGPKAMRKGSTNPREKRMMGQISRAMDRNGDSALHRVRDRGGTGRVNSHSREPPKGRRMMNGPVMHQNNGLGMSMPGAGMPQSPMMFGGMGAGGMGATGGMGMPPQNNPANMFAQFGQWAQQMSQLPPEIQAQFFAGQGMPSPVMSPPFQNPGAMHNGPRHGKSLFERVERPPRKGQAASQKKPNQDTDMGDAPATNGEGSSTTEADKKDKDPFGVVCRFNKTCTKADCPFAHQTPASHTPVTMDLSDTCAHGVACKNYRCTGRHPSPAKKALHHAEENCKYWPNCTNPYCDFKHVPMCKNGADCTTPDCKFTHVKVQCKYNPCLNQACPFKHSEGQARGKFSDKVWTADGGSKEHVSERKFVVKDEDGDEDLVIPGQSSAPTSTAEAVTADSVLKPEGIVQ